MQWPEDSEWDPADPDEEEDEDYEAFNQRRMVSAGHDARYPAFPLLMCSRVVAHAVGD
jgi:hypothetical protein